MREWLPHVTVATVVEQGGRFLLVEERDKQTGELVFNQPAGHLEPGETLTQAALRETVEETGWDVELTAVLGVECRKGSSPYLPGLIAPDVLVPDGVPIHIEAKRRERFSIPAAMRQATDDAPTVHVPLVAHRPCADA